MDQDSKIYELEVKLAALEKEVSLLKAKVKDIEGSPVETGFRKVPTKQTSPIPITDNKARHETVTDRKPIPEPFKTEPTDWEKVLLQTWLPRLFIFVFIVGIVWGFKAASDYGWLNDGVKISLGYLTAAGLLFIGFKQMHHKREVLGQVLLGGGISVLILATFSMHSLYGMIGPILAFTLQVVWIIVGVWLTMRFSSQGLAIISVVGGFLVPFLIESSDPSIYIFVGYETLLFLVFLFLAIRLRFLYLYVSSFLLLNGALLFYYAFSPEVEGSYLLSTAVIIQHAVLLYFFLTTDHFMKVQAGTVFSSVFITYTWVYGIFQDLSITLYLLFGIATYAVLSFLWKQQKHKVDQLAINGLLFLFFFLFHFFSEEYLGALLLLQGIGAFYAAFKYKSLASKVLSVFIFLIGTMMVLVDPIKDPLSFETFQWLILLVTFVIGIMVVWQFNQAVRNKALTIGGLLFTFFSLVFVTQLTMAVTSDLPYENRTLWLSFAWMTQAVVVIGVGIWKRFNLAKYIGVGLLVLTLVKLILLDLPFISIQFKAILFIALGLIGLIASRVFYKKK
ncbi:putative membrane protein [Bacillus tianshenii]|uniref:Membrane protein n=1 Tax=Sutcliffiella tianshenii TaxID=1463404 RepID=A0ABS2P345_9BACI|nr:DUF2339 domain-containing protein [Bacillus tianshenii]MBM7620840.1 putative membrane protein [Bacillus tianshenii]